MADLKKNLLLLFDRPAEPCFMEKGEQKIAFQVPDRFYPKKFRALRKLISNRFGKIATRTIPVKEIAMPDLSIPLQLKFEDNFSLFIPKHQEMAGKLIDILLGMKDINDLISVATYCQLNINPYMFNYCLSVTLLNRPDTKDLDIPTLTEIFPAKFMDPRSFNRARIARNVQPEGPMKPIVIPVNFTAAPWDLEQRVAYFREDIGVNLHHWHWHLVYPAQLSNRALVEKDRRGELLYYMHQQIIARYQVERFCNDLKSVVPFGNDFNEPIAEAYFSKLASQVASRSWAPRFAGSVLSDLERPMEEIRAQVYHMNFWKQNILEAIESTSIVMPNGDRVQLDEETGIDVLGNLMEASDLSPNRKLYGDFHNMGHIFMALVHDPDYRHLEHYAVMGDTATTMRDPLFYRWHKFVDDVFVMYKNKLPAYGDDKLNFPGVRVSSIAVEGKAGKNTFATHWEQSTLNLGRGMDFIAPGNILARFTHLQHEEFDYVIEVENTSGKETTGTVRIFIAPVNGDTGTPLEFNEQRRLMIELDKFTQKLQPGKNTIRRRSVDSSVTIPYERVFRDQARRTGQPQSVEAAAFDFCGCGWPQYMLLPKGTTNGYPMVLFVMVSNWADDEVKQDVGGKSSCMDAASYCGLRDRKYPDRRAMGFPFDRPVLPTVKTVTDFLKPNMAIADCKVKFTDTVTVRGQ